MKKEQLMIVDGHVHIHPCFDIQTMLNFALANFRRLECDRAAYFIALSESQSQDYFAHLQQLAACSLEDFNRREDSAGEEDSACKEDSVRKEDNAGEEDSCALHEIGDWQILSTEDPEALLAVNRLDREAAIYILAGRQIVTKEKLEVLALVTDGCFEEGASLEETIEQVLDRGGVPVIPWGFGKWVGRRGQYLQRLLLSAPPGLFLADSSSRPTFWPEPRLFEQARQRGLAILSGTDPFPLKSEVGRAGLAGFKIAGAFDAQKPATSLRQALRAASSALRGVSSQVSSSQASSSQASSLDSLATLYPLPAVYGPLETPFRCFRNQLAMQFIKRFRSRA